MKVPKSALRPVGVGQQGPAPARQIDAENAGGYGGGPRSSGDRGHAVRWALTQLRSQDWYWHCELFVEQAYGTEAIYASAKDAAAGIRLHDQPVTDAPRGALVYFRADASNNGLGHVGLALGHGKMISALATVTQTDVANSPYWRSEYLGWGDAPVTWPGRPATPPRLQLDPGISIRMTGPADGDTISGPETFYVSAVNVSGVALRAFYAANPRDATTRGWHELGKATKQRDSWVLTLDTTTIQDQGQPDWGTVRVEAIALDARGAETGNRDSRRYVVNNVAVTSPPPTAAPQTHDETNGGDAHTWSDYVHAAGRQGPTIPSNLLVKIRCKVQGFQVADGDTWWYRIASAPWSDKYYVSADAFYNNGQTTGSLHGTPFVDPAVPLCAS